MMVKLDLWKAPTRIAASSRGRGVEGRRGADTAFVEMMVKLDLWKAPDPEALRNRALRPHAALTLPLSDVVAN